MCQKKKSENKKKIELSCNIPVNILASNSVIRIEVVSGCKNFRRKIFKIHIPVSKIKQLLGCCCLRIFVFLYYTLSTINIFAIVFHIYKDCSTTAIQL